MRLSTKGRYATRIMVYLARNQDGVPCRKQGIADAEDISADYVEQLLMKLKTAGLVRSHRGAKGGFTLGRDATGISVADVLEATEGPLTIVPCLEKKCKRSCTCVTRPVWQEATDALYRLFSGRTIASLAEAANQIESAVTHTYHI